jgi:hypothetical protein
MTIMLPRDVGRGGSAGTTIVFAEQFKQQFGYAL